MDFGHEQSWQKLEALLAEQKTITKSWPELIDFHEAIKPKPYWQTLKHLDVGGEQKEIVGWLEQILKDSPLPRAIVALWIGISRIYDEESEREYYAICLRAADHYDAEDIDWADDPRYEPENNYGIVGVLSSLHELILEDEEDYDFLDWILPISYMALTMDEIIRTRQLDSRCFSGLKNGLYVSVGFEEGDHIDVSRIE